MRVLQFVGAVFLLISFPTLVFLYSNNLQSFVVRELMSALSRRVGLEFEIESISIRVGNIEVNNASLYEPGVGPLIDLEYGALEFRLLSLLRGEVNIHNVRLDKPRVFVDYEHDLQRSDSQFRLQRLRDMFLPEWYEPKVRDQLFTTGPSVYIGHIQIRSGSLVFEDHQRGFHLSDIRMGGAAFRYGGGEIQVSPGVISFEMKAGTTVESYSSGVRYSGGPVRISNEQLRVDTFELWVGDSLVQGAAGALYDSVPRELSQIYDIDIELHIFQAELIPNDIADLVLPWMPASVPALLLTELNEYAPYRLDLDIAGNLQELRLGYGEVRSHEGGMLRARGTAWDVAHLDELRFELEFEGLIPDLAGLIEVSSRVAGLPHERSNGNQDEPLEQPALLKELSRDPRFPGMVLYSGHLEGNPAGTLASTPVLSGNLDLETLQGRVVARGVLTEDGRWGESLPFELEVSTEDYSIAAYSREGGSRAERLSLAAHATGDALRLEESEAEAHVRLEGIQLAHSGTAAPPRLDAELDLRYRERELSLAARVAEDVLDLALNGILRLDADTELSGEGELEIGTASFVALGLREDDLQLSGDILWSFTTLSEALGTAELQARDITFSLEGESASIEQLNAHLSVTPGLTELSVGSEILDLRYAGSIGPLTLAARGMELLQLHVATVPGIALEVDGADESGERVEAWFELHDTEVLAGILIPELRSIAPFSAGLVYDDSSSQFQLSGWVPALQYEELELEDLSLNAVLDRVSLRGDVGLAAFRSQAMDATPTTADGAFEILDMHLEFHTEDMRLMSELYAGTILGEETGSILASLNLSSPEAPGPLSFEILDLRIAALQGLLGNDAERVEGVLAGSGELELEELLLSFELQLRDSISDMQVVGSYDRPNDYMNVILELPRLDMEYLEGFAFGELEETRGYVSGRAQIEGRLEEPELSGELEFHEVELTLPRLGSRFAVDGQELLLSNNGVQFENFTVTDASGVPARVNGRITAEFDQGNHEVDLQLSTRGFRAIDTTAADNPLFFGRVIVDAEARVVGLVNEATLEGNLGLRSGSNVTFVMPEQDTAIDATRGIIRFVDDDLSELDSASGIAATGGRANAQPQPLVGGVEVGVNVQVDSDTQVTMVVDQASGDRLVLRGGGQFSLAVDRSGETSLTGTYTISGGEYQLSFQNIVRRNFRIMAGSNVTWVGDPFDAQLNVTAEYSLRASPASLVGAYLTEQETAAYRRSLPFQVLLELQGAMSEPEISFQLDMPQAERGALAGTVYNRLQQLNENEAERNRQAFALLVFNQFLGEEFTGFDQGAAVAGGARSSAARLLSQQLNIISARVIPGLDLAFEIESYEEIGETGPEGRTELHVQLSRQFLDDRVSIELGGQFELEGERSEGEDMGDFAGDIVVEYLITEDGRYRIRGFRRNEYQGPIEGTQATTGVALVYTRTFDRLRELFRRPRPDTELQLPDPGFEQDRS